MHTLTQSQCHLISDPISVQKLCATSDPLYLLGGTSAIIAQSSLFVLHFSRSMKCDRRNFGEKHQCATLNKTAATLLSLKPVYLDIKCQCLVGPNCLILVRYDYISYSVIHMGNTQCHCRCQ